MATGKKSFILYRDILAMVSKMPDDAAGKLFKHVLEYVNDLEPEEPDDLLVSVAFEPIKQQLKRDLEKYQGVVDRNKANGKKGGRPKANGTQANPNNPVGLSGIKIKPRKADTDTDTDTGTGTDTGTDINKNPKELRTTAAQPPPAKNEITPKKKSNAEPKSTAVWERYRSAYQAKYQAEPVRNAKVNKQLCMLVDRLGADVAPEVAAFYLTHNGAFYVTRMHSVDLLLHDAEKLHTEWQTGSRMTTALAHQVDQTQHNAGVVERVIAQRRAEGKL